MLLAQLDDAKPRRCIMPIREEGVVPIGDCSGYLVDSMAPLPDTSE